MVEPVGMIAEPSAGYPLRDSSNPSTDRLATVRRSQTESPEIFVAKPETSPFNCSQLFV